MLRNALLSLVNECFGQTGDSVSIKFTINAWPMSLSFTFIPRHPLKGAVRPKMRGLFYPWCLTIGPTNSTQKWSREQWYKYGIFALIPFVRDIKLHGYGNRKRSWKSPIVEIWYEHMTDEFAGGSQPFNKFTYHFIALSVIVSLSV